MVYKSEIILEEVCNRYKITPAMLFRNTRKREVIIPRQMYFFLCTQFSGMTLSDIGRTGTTFGRRAYDHATVLHAKKVIRGFLDIRERDTVRNHQLILEALLSHKIEWQTRLIPSDVDLLKMTRVNQSYANNVI